MAEAALAQSPTRWVLPLKTCQKRAKRKLEDKDSSPDEGTTADATRQHHREAQPLSLDVALVGHQTLTTKRKAHLLHRQRNGPTLPPLNTNLVSRPQLDAFKSWPIHSTPTVARMAQYYVQNWAPEHGPAFAMPGHKNPYLSLLWPFAMECEIYFESLVTLCLATWLPAQNIPTKSDHSFLYHRGRVVAKLRQRLARRDQCADDTTILVVATLGTIDYVLGDHDTAITHVQGMRQMEQIRGGFDATSQFEQLVKANILAYESLWTFVTKSSTLVDDERHTLPPIRSPMLRQGQLPTYMSHPFRPDICVMLSRLPRGYCDVSSKGVLSLQMIQILSALNQVSSSSTGDFSNAISPISASSPISIASLTSSSTLPTPTTPNKYSDADPTTVRLILEDLHRLATLQVTLTEHVLCYGLIAYCFLLQHTHCHGDFGALYTPALDVLISKVIKNSPEDEDLDRGIYLWSAISIATAAFHVRFPHMNESGETKSWKQRTGINASGQYLVWEHLIKTHPEVKSYATLSKTMKNFFWVDEVEAMVRKSWEETRMKAEVAKFPILQPTQTQTVGRARARGMSIRDVIL